MGSYVPTGIDTVGSGGGSGYGPVVAMLSVGVQKGWRKNIGFLFADDAHQSFSHPLMTPMFFGLGRVGGEAEIINFVTKSCRVIVHGHGDLACGGFKFFCPECAKVITGFGADGVLTAFAASGGGIHDADALITGEVGKNMGTFIIRMGAAVHKTAHMFKWRQRIP